MNTKLTLVMESDVIQSAKAYADRHGTSVSKLVEQYITLVSGSDADTGPSPPKRGPLTSALVGSIQSLKRDEMNASSKELVGKAKAERFG
ncbi:MAG: hypothetical protein JJU29_07985 [Verrucomicrobia bacterium]|nr:hypothetical protein [Verrucomicrobiota bacterium]MCH8511896.1 DUF6364 family protein [Kiritimatiellia bacterium]